MRATKNGACLRSTILFFKESLIDPLEGAVPLSVEIGYSFDYNKLQLKEFPIHNFRSKNFEFIYKGC